MARPSTIATGQPRRARDRMAIVFQQYNLFQNMSVLGNVTIAPVEIKGRPAAEVEVAAERILAKVGLGDKHDAYPDQLSGGPAAARRHRPGAGA